MTHLTTQPLPQEVWRARHFNFEPWKTYYILTRFYQEEFRGIYFVPELVSKEEAMQLAKNMIPAGTLAEKAPLYKEEKVPQQANSEESIEEL